jgi:DNA-binding transcriptional MerR regulator
MAACKKTLDLGIDSNLYNAAAMKEARTKSYLRVGELARATGVSADTLRHYERMGVLPRPHRSENGYRQYPPDFVERVRIIRRALVLGFTLDELAKIFGSRESGGAPCRKVRNLAASKLVEIEARMKEMKALRQEFRNILREWDRRLSKTPRERAYLLESLGTKNLTAVKGPKHFKLHMKRKNTKEQR